MRENKLHTPYGVRDFLPKDCFIKTQIENRIELVFNRYGFAPIKSPMFEYMEVFETSSGVKPKQMYKFIDRDGEILALRSDFTPPISRIAATNFSKSHWPLRFCYTGNVFRYNESYQGKLREFTQSGIELIGVNNIEADAEVLAVAINSLLATGLKNFGIDIGQIGFLKGVIEESGLDLQTCEAIQENIVNKNFVMVNEILKNKSLPMGVLQLLDQLPMFVGSMDILQKAKTLINNEGALKALESMEEVYNIIKCYGLENYIRFDLSMISLLDYYSGIIFSGYCHGTGFSVLDGGRYDNLIWRYGVDMPSVGFSVKINELITALENQGVVIPVESADTLLVYTKEGRNTALATADQLRIDGVSIENSLIYKPLDENIKYAKSKGISGIIYFIDSNNIQLINLKNDEVENITLEQLLKNQTER